MIIIRAMEQRDVPGVMEIENEVVEFPWSPSIFSDCIRVGYSCWVLEEIEPTETESTSHTQTMPTSTSSTSASTSTHITGTDIARGDTKELNLEETHGIVGYGLLSFSGDEAHILNICITGRKQGHGLGLRLMQHMLGVARKHNAKTAYLEVRISNQRAIDLYHKLGFKQINIREGYYPAQEGREDAYVLQITFTNPFIIKK